MTRQPARRNLSSVSRSRPTLDSSFVFHQTEFDFGHDACSGHTCQKQPSTKTAKRAAGNPGLLHYGIHATEILCTLMGPGCQAVTAIHSPGADVVTGEWADGRLGTLRGQRDGSTAYGFTAFCEHGVIPQSVSARYSYRNL